MRSRAFAIAVFIGVLAIAAPPALPLATADEHDLRAEHCVSIKSIDRTDVISDFGILFYMKGGDVYLNKLPHRCPGLVREDTFMYRSSIGQLCDLDIITVLDNIGFGFRSGVSCGLGMFHPVSEDEIEALKADESRDH